MSLTLQRVLLLLLSITREIHFAQCNNFSDTSAYVFEVEGKRQALDKIFIIGPRMNRIMAQQYTSNPDCINTNTANNCRSFVEQESTEIGQRLNKIIKNYDRKIRPNTGGKPTHVQIELKIVSFGPIQESDQTYSLDIFFRQWWNDPTLAGVVNKTITMAIDPNTIIWIPDTYFVNGINPEFQEVTKSIRRLLLHPNGDIYYSSRIILKASCPMDFTLYPMDKQTCPLVIESYAYTQEDVYYTWYESKGKLRKTKGVEWVAGKGPVFTLIDVTSLQKQISNNSKGAFSSLKIEFHLERSNGFYFWNTYLPGGILVLMTWVNFWIPPWAYPARVTVCVTSFLSTLVVMSTAGNQLGRVSYVKAIDYFLIGNATFVLMILLEYVLVLHSWWNINFDCFKKDTKNKKHKSDPDDRLSSINEACEYENGNPSVIHLKERSQSLNHGSFMNRLSCDDLRGKSFSHGFTEEANNHRNGNSNPSMRNRKSSTILALKQFQDKHKISTEQAKSVHALDLMSRFIFPICYFLFVVGYCAYFNII